MLQTVWLACTALRRDARGASGIEYALLAAMVAVALGGIAVAFQHSFATMFSNINTSLAGA
jgi:Flp pilus assembly pilin Flp